MKDSEAGQCRSLREIEAEVDAEMREWGRQRPAAGDIKLQVWSGLNPVAQSWGCPMRQRWVLTPQQRTSPGLEDKVLFTATATGTYEQAAAVVSKWGSPMESACRQKQCRYKRPGQFWTAKGLRHLQALEEARAHGHWDELWLVE